MGITKDQAGEACNARLSGDELGAMLDLLDNQRVVDALQSSYLPSNDYDAIVGYLRRKLPAAAAAQPQPAAAAQAGGGAVAQAGGAAAGGRLARFLTSDGLYIMARIALVVGIFLLVRWAASAVSDRLTVAVGGVMAAVFVVIEKAVVPHAKRKWEAFVPWLLDSLGAVGGRVYAALGLSGR